MVKRIFLAAFLSFAATNVYSQNSQENEFATLPQDLMEKMWEARTITDIDVSGAGGSVYVVNAGTKTSNGQIIESQKETVFKLQTVGNVSEWLPFGPPESNLNQSGKSKLTSILAKGNGNSDILFLGGLDEVRKFNGGSWLNKAQSEYGLPQTKDFKVNCFTKYLDNQNETQALIGLAAPPGLNEVENGIPAANPNDPDYGTLFRQQISPAPNISWQPLFKNFTERFDLPVVDIAVSQVNPLVIFVVVNNNDENATFNGNPNDKSALNQNNNLWWSNNGGNSFEKVFGTNDVNYSCYSIDTKAHFRNTVIPHITNVELAAVDFGTNADPSWATTTTVTEKVFFTYCKAFGEVEAGEILPAQIETDADFSGLRWFEITHYQNSTQIDLNTKPSYLDIKRFEFDCVACNFETRIVKFPITDFKIKKILSTDAHTPTKFRLYVGSIGFGFFESDENVTTGEVIGAQPQQGGCSNYELGQSNVNLIMSPPQYYTEGSAYSFGVYNGLSLTSTPDDTIFVGGQGSFYNKKADFNISTSNSGYFRNTGLYHPTKIVNLAGSLTGVPTEGPPVLPPYNLNRSLIIFTENSVFQYRYRNMATNGSSSQTLIRLFSTGGTITASTASKGDVPSVDYSLYHDLGDDGQISSQWGCGVEYPMWNSSSSYAPKTEKIFNVYWYNNSLIHYAPFNSPARGIGRYPYFGTVNSKITATESCSNSKRFGMDNVYYSVSGNNVAYASVSGMQIQKPVGFFIGFQNGRLIGINSTITGTKIFLDDINNKKITSIALHQTNQTTPVSYPMYSNIYALREAANQELVKICGTESSAGITWSGISPNITEQLSGGEFNDIKFTWNDTAKKTYLLSTNKIYALDFNISAPGVQIANNLSAKETHLPSYDFNNQPVKPIRFETYFNHEDYVSEHPSLFAIDANSNILFTENSLGSEVNWVILSRNNVQNGKTLDNLSALFRPDQCSQQELTNSATDVCIPDTKNTDKMIFHVYVADNNEDTEGKEIFDSMGNFYIPDSYNFNNNSYEFDGCFVAGKDIDLTNQDLTIENSTFYFVANQSLGITVSGINSHLWIENSLLTSAKIQDGEENEWKGVKLVGSSIPNNLISDTEINSTEIGIKTAGAYLKVISSIITRCYEAGIMMLNGNENSLIYGCEINSISGNGIHLDDTFADISISSIENCSVDGIFLTSGYSGEIKNNTIKYCEGNGILLTDIQGNGNTVSILKNEIKYCASSGLAAENCSNINILIGEENNFSNANSIKSNIYALSMLGNEPDVNLKMRCNSSENSELSGLIFYDSDNSIVDLGKDGLQGNPPGTSGNNSFAQDNDGYILENLKTNSIDAIGNWWGTIDTQEMESRIIGLVNFSPALAEKPSGLPKPNFANLPKVFSLHQNYPNPFNPTTTISYDIPERAEVELKIYNILGQEVIYLVKEIQEAGNYQVVWNGNNYSGKQVGSGIYFTVFKTDKFKQTRKMLFLK